MSSLGRILVVDDTLASLKLMSDTLRSESYEVISTDNGEMAVAAARAKLPDLILCDMRMPGIDGLEVCRILKKDVATRDVPFMFISATTATEEKVAGFAVGAVDFVSKPFQRDELLARVRTHLELSRLRFQLEYRVAQRTSDLLAARNRAQSYLDLVEVTIVSLDVEGNVRMLNRAGIRQFGYDSEAEVVGRHWFSDFLAQPDGLETELAWFLSAASGRSDFPEYIENTVVNRRGDRRTMAWHNSVERDSAGAVTAMLSAGEDITERKLNETLRQELSDQLQQALNSLEAANRQLENNVQRRTSELDTAHSKLRQTSGHLAQAERFASLVNVVSRFARELQAPVASGLGIVTDMTERVSRFQRVSAGAETVPTQHLEELFGQWQTAVGALRHNLIHAERVISEIDQMSLTRSYEQRREFSVQSLVGEVLASQLRLFKASRHQVHLRIAPSLVLEGFPRALGQVLTNLVNNALTHAFADGFDGEITIGAELVADDQVILTVADNGVGIRDHALSRVFDSVFPTGDGEGGRGLGLAMVHATVHDVLGGTVKAENQQPGGALFTLSLPRRAPVWGHGHG